MTASLYFRAAVPLLCLLAGMDARAITPIPPGADHEVVELLPAVTRLRPAQPTAAPSVLDPASAAEQARQAIAAARQSGDARYWGRAQALLAPWWDKPDAPADLAVLQATVQQGRHAFDAARKVLVSALQRSPGHAQGWLNLAALERLSARYDAALQACDALAQAQQQQLFYAQACRLETWSLQGRTAAATQGFQALLADTAQRGQRSWLLSLLAEHLERAGDDAAAARAYQDSLQQESDLYTRIAYSDLLLRTGQPAQALRVLANLPETDAVLLRRAVAWRRSGDARWLDIQGTLRARAAELVRRGDDPTLHGRERALVALWLDDDAPGALALARANLLLQREPLDWWLAVTSARQAHDGAALAQLDAQIRTVGLHDVRLAPKTAARTAVALRGKP